MGEAVEVTEAEEGATSDEDEVETGEFSEAAETTADEDEVEIGEFSDVAEAGEDVGV